MKWRTSMNTKHEQDRPQAPDSLTEALRIAVNSGREFFAAPKKEREIYRPNSRRWHTEPGLGGNHSCEFCAGGAIIARRLGFNPTQHTDLSDWETSDQAWWCALHAINFMRMGCWALAALAMNERAATDAQRKQALRFADAMDKELDKHTTSDYVNFFTWGEYERWIDWAEHTALPALSRCEGRST